MLSSSSLALGYFHIPKSIFFERDKKQNMAERTDSRRRGFGDPVPFWLAVLARVFAIIGKFQELDLSDTFLGLPFLIWTSVQLFVEPTKVDFRKATLKLDIRQILLAFILT